MAEQQKSDPETRHLKPHSVQADPGERFALYTLDLCDIAENALSRAQLISTNPAVQASPPLYPGEETWSVPADFLSSLASATKIHLVGTELRDAPQFSSPQAASLFTMAGTVTWAAAPGPFSTAAFFGTTSHGGLGLLVSLVPPGPLSPIWSGTLTWYLAPANGQAPHSGAYAFGASDTPLDLVRTSPQSLTGWYSATLPPTTI